MFSTTNKLIILFFLVLLFCSCSRQIIRQTIREIDRPLFLPSKNWHLFLENEFSRFISTREDAFDYVQMYPDYGLQVPPISLGQYVDYCLPATFRIYLKKNITCSNGISKIGGLNIGIVNKAKIRFLMEPLQLRTSHLLLLKKPLSERFWIESQGGVHLIFPFNEMGFEFGIDAELPVTIGYQVTDRFSVKGTIMLNGIFSKYQCSRYVKFSFFPILETIYHRGWLYTERVYDLDIQFPVALKYVFNHHFELSALMGTIIHTHHDFSFSTGLNTTFTW